MSGKFALIIGNTEYTDPGLAQLTAPGKDAEDFARVLKDTEIGAFDQVNVVLNQSSSASIEAIDEFFDQRMPDDLLVLYFSGHGVRDELGALYLAVKNTIRSRLRSTAIKSDYIREAMDQSRSRRQVLILDCCNSGAFAQGTKAATGVSIGTATAFEGGYGRVILTASDSTQFAWEGDKVIGETDNSLFTHYLVEGLEGEADLDGDGRITVDELYDYAYAKVKVATPRQTPSKFSSMQQGEIVLRQKMRVEDMKLMALPDELLDEIEDSRPFVREHAVQNLEKILGGRNIGLARSAREALAKIATDDDSRKVSQAALQVLESFRLVEEKVETERKAREEAQRLAALKAEEERLMLEKAEAERKAKEEAEKLQRARAERETAEREVARLKAEREATEKAAREASEKAKREKKEKEVAEREAAHKAEQVAIELASQKKAEREAAEKAEREAIELVAQKRAERKAKIEAGGPNTKGAIPSASLQNNIKPKSSIGTVIGVLGLGTISLILLLIIFSGYLYYLFVLASPASPTSPSNNFYNVTLDDNFSEKTWGTGTDEKSSVEYSNGTLQFLVFQTNYFVWSTPNDDNYSNISAGTIAINNSTDSTTAFGMICHMQDTKVSYYFAITPAGEYAIGMSQVALDDVFLTNNDKWANSSRIPVNQPSYILEVDCTSSGRLALYVNGQYIDSVINTTYTTGNVALFVWSGEQEAGANISFDQFWLTEIP